MNAIALVPDLEQRLRRVEPGVLLLPAKLLRRVIRRDRHWNWLTFRLPHQQNYALSKERLAELFRLLEEPPPAGELPEQLILLSGLAPKMPVALSTDGQRQMLLAYYWRQLFHARMHRSLQPLSEDQLQQRIDALGESLWEEIRLTLTQERLLLPPVTDASRFEEFSVYFWELKFFAPHLLPWAFPSMRDVPAVAAMLGQQVDAAKLLEQTRPDGIVDPLAWREELRQNQARRGQAVQDKQNVLDTQTVQKLHDRADSVLARGNVTRALRLRRSSTQAADGAQSEEATRRLDEDLFLLAQRLTAALNLPDEAVPAWQKALLPLVRPVEDGYCLEIRALYELQKICVDYERGLFTVDLVEHVRSWFSQPLKRPLPWAETLSRLRRLRRVEQFLVKARLTPEQGHVLGKLLEEAWHHQETLQRQNLRPVLAEAFDAVGLVPQNAAERVARRKVIEELIDRLLAQGHISLGELRDALSRNQLKMADLSGPTEFWRGDPLLRLDRHLAGTLDGAYRRGEFYLRWFQRLSSLFFATPPGRFLTRFVILPFAGAFVALEGLQHIVGPLLKPFLGHEPHLVTILSVLVTGYLLMGLLYVDRFRKEVWAGLKFFGRGLRLLLVDTPRRVANSPLVRGVWNATPIRIFRERLFLPLLLALGGWGVSLALEASLLAQWMAGLLSFFTGFVFFNTKSGRYARELAAEFFARLWHLLGTDFLILLLRFIWDAFRWLVGQLDQALYAVDERLRFRGGENPFTTTVKALVGVVWFGVAYLVRFAINLLLEPQINPIKHFPVVTVSHKLLLPLAVPPPGGVSPLGQLLVSLFGASATTANTTAGVIVWGIPGIFGFLVWELKENWKLYRANRAPTLGPVVVGHHGETVLRLMKPGFHSGTLPKLFAKLRRAETLTEHSPQAVKLHHELQHVGEEVRRLVERDFLAPLEGSAVWQGKNLQVGTVALGAKQIAFTLRAPLWPESLVEIVIREKSGWLLAQVPQPGWLAFLTPAQTEALVTALAGLYKLAGVDLILEQLRDLWPTPTRFQATAAGVQVRPAASAESAVYPWTSEDAVAAEPASVQLPIVPTPKLFFSRLPIAWQHWVVAWEREQQGRPADLPLQEIKLLPAREPAEAL